jgi:hypothetical protein
LEPGTRTGRTKTAEPGNEEGEAGSEASETL